MDDPSNAAQHLERLAHEAGRADRSSAPPFLGQRLVSAVCHDLRSPLSSIVMGAGFLERSFGAEGAEREKRVLESVQRSAQRLSGLIADFHDLAHFEAGQFTVETQRLELGAVLRAAADVHAGLGAKKNVTLSARSPATPLHADADRDRILQALRRLIDNAVRYSPTGGTVRLALHEAQGRAVFSVSDDGPGMSSELLAHAFDPYWHAEQSPRDGTGLGLALVRATALVHRGDAYVESASGAGTQASFWLPLGR